MTYREKARSLTPKREDAAHLASRLLLQRPLWVVVGLLGLAGCIELLQAVPEVLPGGHAFGEVLRNLAYAIVGALVFQWLVVELPARQRRRKTYDFHRQAFQTLVISGPGLLEPYRLAAEAAGVDLDVWDKKSLADFAKGSSLAGPLSSTPARVQMLRTVVETGVLSTASWWSPLVAN